MSIFKNKQKQEFLKQLDDLESNRWERLTMQLIPNYNDLTELFYKSIEHLRFFQRKSSRGIVLRYILTVLLLSGLFILVSFNQKVTHATVFSSIFISMVIGYFITEFEDDDQEVFLRRKEIAGILIPQYEAFKQELLNEISLCENIIERKMNPTVEDIKIYLEQDKTLVHLEEIMSDEQLEKFWNKSKENFCKDQKVAIMHNQKRIELIDEEMKFLESIK